MIKVLFLLSIVVMGVSSFFAWKNGRDFTATRIKKASTHRQISTQLDSIKTVNAEIAKLNGEIDTVQKDVDTQDQTFKGHQLKISQLDSESKNTATEFDTKNKKLEELKAELAKLPQGMKPETLQEDLNKMRQTIAELGSQADAKQKEIDAEQAKVAAVQQQKADLVRKIEDRKKAFERNGLTARIVAVNNDWGFCVINAGKPQGITPDTKLLVTRGTQTVGKLSILAVEGGRTVANILTDSLAPGMSPAPGDRVILENLVQ